MKRLLALAATLVLGLGILVPAALAASPLAHNGRVIVSTQGDVTIPAGEHADVVVVVQGAAHIQGEVNTLVIVDGVAHLADARLDTVVAVSSSVEVADGTVISGELQRFDSSVHQTGNVTIEGGITDISAWFVQASAVLAPALILLWIGFGLSAILAALLLAALAARQVREAEKLISTEPVVTGLVGLLGAILLPVLAVLLLITVVGAPLGFGFLFGVLPLLAYAGYLVAAIWTGEWLLRVTGPAQERERPFLAAVFGVVVLGAVGLVPIVGLVVTIASLLGFGALLRLGYRTLRGTPRPMASISMPAPVATGA
jgi:hypothetical protein